MNRKPFTARILAEAQDAANEVDHEDHDEAVRVALEAVAHLIAAEGFERGFTACAGEFTKQRKDPEHPITRVNPYRVSSIT